MSRKESPAPLSDSVLAEATAWFIDCNEGELDNSGRERLHQWLRRSPEHVRAYLEIAAAWQDAIKLRGREAVDHAALISTALAETNVVALNAVGRGSGPANRAMKPASRRFRELLYASAAALLIAAIGLVSIRWMGHNIYSTDVGEQRSIVLADGSTVELNARSELRVHFSSAERTVDLLEGQALFHVRKDAVRPFVVVSSGTRVRAVGTQFDVYRKQTGTVVTVIEGRVAVTASHLQVPAVPGSIPPSITPAMAPSTGSNPGGAAVPEGPVLLSAGQQLTVAGQLPAQPVATDVGAAIAWTRRKLIFNETPLADAAAEFNRFNTRRIVIADPALSAYHISGSFDSGDPDRLVQFLRERFDADITESGDEIRISPKK